MTTAEAQLASFFAKYEPPIAKLGKALRRKLRARLPGREYVQLLQLAARDVDVALGSNADDGAGTADA
jgi:hypothetical protein